MTETGIDNACAPAAISSRAASYISSCCKCRLTVSPAGAVRSDDCEHRVAYGQTEESRSAQCKPRHDREPYPVVRRICRQTITMHPSRQRVSDQLGDDPTDCAHAPPDVDDSVSRLGL